jgi:hypothetical protein
VNRLDRRPAHAEREDGFIALASQVSRSSLERADRLFLGGRWNRKRAKFVKRVQKVFTGGVGVPSCEESFQFVVDTSAASLREQ